LQQQGSTVFFASLQYSFPSEVFLQQHFETVLSVSEHVIGFFGEANKPAPNTRLTIAAANAVLVLIAFFLLRVTLGRDR